MSPGGRGKVLHQALTPRMIRQQWAEQQAEKLAVQKEFDDAEAKGWPYLPAHQGVKVALSPPRHWLKAL